MTKIILAWMDEPVKLWHLLDKIEYLCDRYGPDALIYMEDDKYIIETGESV